VNWRKPFATAWNRKGSNPRCDKLPAELEPLIAELRAALSWLIRIQQRFPTRLAATDPTQSRETSAKLAKLLSDCDPAAVDFLEGNHSTLRALFTAEAWTTFRGLVEGYASPTQRRN
jgi:hypothetical protein